MRRAGSSPPTTSPSKSWSAARTSRVGGMAKGCGMIAPNMATMLAFLTTDADVPRSALQKMLRRVADATFNTLNVDGAMSTNDTAMLLASGRRGKADLRRVRQRGARRLQRPDDADGPRCGRNDPDRPADRHRRRQRRGSEKSPPRRSPRTISSNAAGTAAIPTGAGCWRRRARAALRSTSPSRASAMAASWSPRAASASRTTARRSPSI